MLFHASHDFKHLLVLVALGLIIAACDSGNGGNEPPPDDDVLPYSRYLLMTRDSYVEVPHATALNPTSAITLEGWMRLDNGAGGRDIMSKSGFRYYSVGHYEAEVGLYLMESYLWGQQAQKMGGEVPVLEWFHWALTSDGTVRRHYINGEIVAEFAEDEKLSSSTDPLLFARHHNRSGIAEFRLWNVARTPEEIRNTMNVDITEPKPGLVAVWPLEENANDIVGGHDGALINNPRFQTWDPGP